MRRHTILTPSSRADPFEPPRELESAQRRYVLDPDDVVWANAHRRAQNRLGFAVQLALVHDLGRAWLPNETLPDAVVEVVADQLGIEPLMFRSYAARQETRREHAREIVAHLGLRTIGVMDYRDLIEAATASAVGSDHGEPIVRAIVDDLRRRRLIIPGAVLIERLALAGRAQARRQAYRDLIRDLDDAQRRQLDRLITVRHHEEDWSAPTEVVLPEVWFFQPLEDERMPQKKHKPEEIVAKLRQVDVLVSQGRSVAEAVRAISVTQFTY